MTDGVGANRADGGNGITQRSRETEVEQRTVFSVCVSGAPFLCVIPLPPCSPFTPARELEQCRRERSVVEIAAARRNQRIHEGSSACVRHRAPGADAGRAPAEIQPKSRVFGLGCTNRNAPSWPCLGVRGVILVRSGQRRIIAPPFLSQPGLWILRLRQVAYGCTDAPRGLREVGRGGRRQTHENVWRTHVADSAARP